MKETSRGQIFKRIFWHLQHTQSMCVRYGVFSMVFTNEFRNTFWVSVGFILQSAQTTHWLIRLDEIPASNVQAFIILCTKVEETVNVLSQGLTGQIMLYFPPWGFKRGLLVQAERPAGLTLHYGHRERWPIGWYQICVLRVVVFLFPASYLCCLTLSFSLHPHGGTVMGLQDWWVLWMWFLVLPMFFALCGCFAGCPLVIFPRGFLLLISKA